MLKSRQINKLLKLALKITKDEKNISVDYEDGKREFHYPPVNKEKEGNK